MQEGWKEGFRCTLKGRKEGRKGGRRDLATNLTSSLQSLLPSSTNSTRSLCPKCIVLSLAMGGGESGGCGCPISSRKKRERKFAYHRRLPGPSSAESLTHRPRLRQGQTSAHSRQRCQKCAKRQARHTWYAMHVVHNFGANKQDEEHAR